MNCVCNGHVVAAGLVVEVASDCFDGHVDMNELEAVGSVVESLAARRTLHSSFSVSRR